MITDSGMADYMRRAARADRKEAVCWLALLVVATAVTAWAVFAP